MSSPFHRRRSADFDDSLSERWQAETNVTFVALTVHLLPQIDLSFLV